MSRFLADVKREISKFLNEYDIVLEPSIDESKHTFYDLGNKTLRYKGILPYYMYYITNEKIKENASGKIIIDDAIINTNDGKYIHHL